MSQLERNTTTMQTILATVNALPEAGGGGGGAETCTVTVKCSGVASYRPYYISYMTDEDVPAKVITNNSSTSVTLQNVLCGSVVTVSFYSSLGSPTFLGNTTNAELMACRDHAFCAFKITAPSGGTATINNANSSGGGSLD